MPRAYQAYPQNAVVTHSPASVGGGDTSGAVNGGKNAFQIPSTFDVCAPATGGTRNPFISGLNTMGEGTGNSTGVAGQTGNIMSGLQIFSDSLCGLALGGTTTSEVIAAWRHIREQGDDPREVYRAVRRLRDSMGTGTTPQSVLAGVQAVTNITNTNPAVQNAIATGQAAAGVSGNQIIDSIHGTQTMANQGHQLLTGQTTTAATGSGLLTAGGAAINQNTANHTANQSLSTAQSVALKQENLLVSQDFASSYTIVGDAHWSWDGTDSAPGSVLGCAKVVCDGHQQPLVSSEIPVVAGENIEVACEVKWSGLTYTGSAPIILAVEKYRLMKDPAGSGQNVYSDVGWYEVATVTKPASSSGWTGIAGTYTVEPNVDQLRFRLEAAPTVTAGTVKWDAAEFLKLDLIAAECVPTVTSVDTVVTNLYGSQGSGFTQNEAAVALAATAASLSSVAAKTASLSAEGSTGSIAGDDFNWTGEIIASANWGGSYATTTSQSYVSTFGTYQANGSDAAWVDGSGFATQPGPISSVYGKFDWQGTDAISATDYQLIQLILDSPPQTDSGFVWANIRIYGRISSDWSNYVFLDIEGNGTYSVQCSVGGTLTTLNSGSCSVPGAGTTLSFYLGDKTSTTPRRFRALANSTAICDFTESGTVSLFGSSYRKWGWGGAASVSLSTWLNPPSVAQWLAQDQ